AIWGHISDGNVHPNVIPATMEDVVRGKQAILECGREIVSLGGCPLAEHCRGEPGQLLEQRDLTALGDAERAGVCALVHAATAQSAATVTPCSR
ncbi:MAG: hypothetical protein OXF98_01015, partial [Rhodospirillaceae bacterium]|nr:hypothetical protein [Rhodospirillaceae bacterium]